MKVLVVTSSYPSVRAPYNGVFIRDHVLMTACQTDATPVVLAPRVFREDPLELQDDEVPVVRFRFLSGQRLLAEYQRVPYVRMATYLLSGIVRGVRLARSQQVALIHAHWAIPTGVIGAAVSQLSSLPLVVTVHGSDIRRSAAGGGMMFRLAKWVLHRADHVIAVSSALHDTVIDEFGVAQERVHVVPMGVDTELFATTNMQEARADLGVPPQGPVVLFVGSLVEGKGVAELLEAMQLLRKRLPDILLYMIGDGPLREELAARIAGEMPETVELVGAVPHEDLPRWMNAADVLVLPSKAEGQPVSLMEAAAVGLPIVATDVGGCAQICALDPASTLIESGDAERIAAGVESSLAAGSERVRRPRIDGGDPLSQQACVEKIVHLYEQAAATNDA